jgi:hypothetical protein
MTTSTPLVTTLNRAWQALQRNHPEIPSVMIVTGRRRHKAELATRGSHCADTWHADGHEGRLAEVWISGERLSEGGTAVMQTLIHEAAHALAGSRGVKDTSNRNRYHNRAFVKLAEELGLEGPAASGGPTLGYSDCQITLVTMETYSFEIKELDAACRNFVAPTMKPGTVTRRPKVKAFCECPEGDNEINWTKAFQKKLQDSGMPPILCGICRQAFVPEDDPV